MINNKKILAIIPARGGSKRLPKKNILVFHGKPMISWTIEAALDCDFVDDVVVTSDSDQTLNIASKYNVALERRSSGLASDTATSIDVAVDILSRYDSYDIIVWLQPTSPLRSAKHISEAIQLYIDLDAKSVVSVNLVNHSPDWIGPLDANGQMSKFYSQDVVNKRSQDLGAFYELNGAIYVNSSNMLKDEKQFIGSESFAYKMSRESSIDIDDAVDFAIAECLFSSKLQ